MRGHGGWVENPVKDLRGWVAFFDTDGTELNRVQVGALPDMLVFTPNGQQVVVANEGEPFALGRKDHSLPGNGLDPSDRDGVAAIRTFDNVYGIHMPDAIANLRLRGQTYLLTANEGDARAYTGLTDESRARDLRDITGGARSEALCADEFPDRENLIEQFELGRLTVSTIDGYDPDRNCFAELHAFGARSFSIFTTDGELVWDSGDAFEQLTLERFPVFFNAGHANPEFDNRSDNKGPEPDGVAVEKINGRVYAFIGFERVGGVVTYDVTDPRRPVLVDYVNNRDFAAQLDGGDAGDLGPEGITVIPAGDSPNSSPLVVVANEVSGTTTLFEVVSRR